MGTATIFTIIFSSFLDSKYQLRVPSFNGFCLIVTNVPPFVKSLVVVTSVIANSAY